MTDRISRSFDFNVNKTESRDDGLTLEGYAAVFDSPTEINSWEGEFTETIARGAFSKTLEERTPVLQFDHGTHPLIGSLPLGSISTIREDDRGLFVRARLSDNWLTQPVRDSIANGSVTGMSFRFQVLRDEWEDDHRTIREVKLFEVGPVVWPAYEDTTVGVRSEISDVLACSNLRDELARALTFASDAATRTSEEDTPPLEAPVRLSKQERMNIARPLLAGPLLTSN